MFLLCSLFASGLLGVSSQLINYAQTDGPQSSVISGNNDFQPRLFGNYRRNTWQNTNVVQNQPVPYAPFPFAPAQNSPYEYPHAQNIPYQYSPAQNNPYQYHPAQHSPYHSSPVEFNRPMFQITFPAQHSPGFERVHAEFNNVQKESSQSSAKSFPDDDEATFMDFNDEDVPGPFNPSPKQMGARSGPFSPQFSPQFQPQFPYVPQNLSPQQVFVPYGGQQHFQQQHQSGARSAGQLEHSSFEERDELDEAIGVLPMSTVPMSGARGLLEYDQPNVVTDGAPWIVDVTGPKLQDVLSSDKYWVVIFYTNWCEFTPQVAPFFRTLTNNFRGLVNAGAFDLDQDSHYKYLFNITDHPAVMFFFGDKRNPVIYPPRGSKVIRPREMGNLLARLLFQAVADISYDMKLGKWCFQRVNGECHAFERN